ncbi:hypothetical protein MYCTH_2311581 [Thermothelomyces thermophilus ATCC 42464]|uniref:Biogenesis of lysosome-related organelles complex 1 subunit KXD1 n=1 Tax=Thermothelomyces thermophilus (strain ATCC 42464 / BCRC 31852 / DSM 1799) TaxID=573729 RepID=G2QPC0_THET4|nr:uncharacterized protein MYCTH_2311581 [Thermothelomyces thermophilus ATCC 42464]AEO61433.1 hypothetical protein MYCTH_2311581 [Thermothelomyces thermophilus ATCC 42464]
MSSTYAPQYYATGALPIPPSKPQYQYPGGSHQPYYPYGDDGAYAVSPPEDLDDLDASASSTSGYGNSYSVGTVTTTSSSSTAAGSNISGGGGRVEYDRASSSAGSASGIDLNEFMQERFAATFDPLALDKCTAKQAQTSGHLNAKHRELLELQAKAQARLAKTRARFAKGLEDAREVRNDLEWTQKKVTSLKATASRKHSKEYARARERYPSPDMY